MKKIYYVFIILLFTGIVACNNDVNVTDLEGSTQIGPTEYENAFSTTESFNATVKGVYRVYEWGKSCRSVNYYTQSGNYMIGFISTGSSSCFTEKTYKVRAKFSHPNFKNSQITNIVIKFDIKSAVGTPYPTAQVVVPNKNCAYSEDAQALFDCLSCYSPNICYLVANEIQSTGSWQTKTITINSSTNPDLDIFEADKSDFVLGFSGNSRTINIGNINCDITYTP